ncbi:hypothetical protein LUZ60_016482 [Juncus effusus]|nr:hypothetical protein LUZ60_016482 [Juncus effusus]
MFVSSMIMEGQWQKKVVYTFYLGFVGDFFHLLLHTLFSIAVFPNYGVPIYLIRKLYEIFRNSRTRVSDYFQYRKITSSMNDRFPDATHRELELGDATCAICREELTSAKKLLCCHLFHAQCLRSWLQRQHTCPTCRALIEPANHAGHP